jgi:hypothetical protein
MRGKPGHVQVVSLAVRSDSLSALWSHFRRLAASVMLLAVASFVFHSGAMAGLHQHGLGSTDCAQEAFAGHVHQAVAHDRDDHADGEDRLDDRADHDHARLTGDGATDDRQAAAGDTCCANVCTVALTAVAPDTLSAPIGVTAELLPESQGGASTHLDRLKRPPRTSGIA